MNPQLSGATDSPSSLANGAATPGALAPAPGQDQRGEAKSLRVPVHDKPTSELVVGIVNDAQKFITSYGELVKHDLKAELRELSIALVAGTIAVGIGVAGLIFFLVAAAFALVEFAEWPNSAAFALVGAVILVSAAIAGTFAKKMFDRVDAPEATRELQKDAEWISDNT